MTEADIKSALAAWFPEAEPAKVEPARFSFRKNGKVHRGITIDGDFTTASCSCPGSRNGRLMRGAVRVAEGWDLANCGN